jgi:hypothetical protein
MRKWTARHWPLLGALAAYGAITALLAALAIPKTGGRFVYLLDDAYIHMAVAKNAALHHVWGITRYQFSSSTSSPLWTFILTLAYSLFGVDEVAPLILNIGAGILLLVSCEILLRRWVESRAAIFAVLLVVVFVMPLSTLTLLGMEHLLHGLLVVWFADDAADILSGAGGSIPGIPKRLMFLAPFLTMIRYEGLFLVFVVCLCLLIRKRLASALALGVAALLPVTAYGVWSMAHGWYFFPNSVLLKGHLPELSPIGLLHLLGYRAMKMIDASPEILLLLLAAVSLVLADGGKAAPRRRWAGLILVGTTLLQAQFADFGGLYRYDAYLVLLGVLVCAQGLADLLSENLTWRWTRMNGAQRAFGLVLAGLVAAPFALRSFAGLREVPDASLSIYQQQYQMGLFFREYWQGEAIALNDIGAVSYLSDVKLIDLVGLGTEELAVMRLHRTLSPSTIASLAKERGIRVAILYPGWLNPTGGMPPDWEEVGQWKIPNRGIVASATVSIFAVDPSRRDELIRDLRAFGHELPAGVTQKGEYVEEPI